MTSSGVGGRPVRSYVTRRMSDLRSASGDGVSTSFSRRAKMKLSMALRTHAPCFTSGTACAFGAMNDQCSSYSAPSFTHSRKSAICSGFRVLCASGGGMRSLGFFASIFRTSGLLSGCPAMMEGPYLSCGAKANSARSSRSLAFRAPGSGPWHA